jgi:hypothetical protein
MTRELPILYSAPMVLACLAGLKTQTRRLPPRELWGDVAAMLAWGTKRYGKPGDMLYAREAHAIEECGDDGSRLVYRADRAARWCGGEVGEIFYLESNYQPAARWRPGIHMHKWASRIRRNRTTDLRVVPLQSISFDDVIAEAVTPGMVAQLTGVLDYAHLSCYRAFAAGWDHINGARGAWSENPPVLVVPHAAHNEERAA